MTNDFWDKINKERVMIDTYKELRNTEKERPLYLYGAGNLAEALYKELTAKNIKIAGCIVDETDSRKFFHKLPVYSMDEIRHSGKKCDLLIAFAAGFRKKEKLSGEKEIFEKVYSIANPFLHHKHFDMNFVTENRGKLSEIYQMFGDERSRDVFCAFLNARIYEDERFVLPFSEEDMDEFNNDVMHTDEKEVFLDIGAYQGGSIRRFLKSNNHKFERIIGIEPEDHNFDMLVSNLADISADMKKLIKIGCWKEKGRLAFNDSEDKCCRLDPSAESFIEVDTIDNLCKDETRITMLNLGISTAELEILQGAYHTIKNNRPKLVVFMGAAKEELITIPEYIRKRFPEYSLYLRFQSAMPSRMFLFGI